MTTKGQFMSQMKKCGNEACKKNKHFCLWSKASNIVKTCLQKWRMWDYRYAYLDN